MYAIELQLQKLVLKLSSVHLFWDDATVLECERQVTSCT